MSEKKISTPLSDSVVESLRIGDKVLLSGTLYAARDAAHKRLVELIDKGEKLPFDPKGQIIYFVTFFQKRLPAMPASFGLYLSKIIKHGSAT